MTIKEFMDGNKALDNRFTSPSGEKLSETMAKSRASGATPARKAISSERRKC